MDRRKFLSRAMYFTVASATATLTACGGSDTAPVISGPPAPAGGTFSFPLGVASGDPKDSSVVFWTRVVSAAGGDIALNLQVSTSDKFDSNVSSVPLTASATYDWTVRAKLTNLSPATRYYYRFVAGQDISPTGTAKTAPAATSSPSQLKFAWFTCQDWSINHWAAMEMMAAEDIDFMVHLGDYIYETVGANFQAGQAEPAHAKITLPNGTSNGTKGGVFATSLEDYRTLYRTYRGDARLQTLHAKFPMIAIWDDHEFSDDCWQDRQTYTNANVQQTARRRAANQAWAEYMVVDFGDVSFDLNKAGYDNIKIYRDFKFGNLMHLVMTDERLYRDDHIVSESELAFLLGHDQVNGDDSIGTRYFVPKSLLETEEGVDTNYLKHVPSMLGATQTQWWKDTMKASTATWKVWGNEVTLNRMWVDLRQVAPAPYNQLYVMNADAWDGYPKARADLMGYVKTNNIQNLVAITGDLHAFQCGVIRDNPDPAVGTPVAVDFVAAGISSDSFYHYIKAGAQGTPLTALVASPQVFDGLLRQNNPDFAYVDHDAQGYATATITPTQMTVMFNKVKPLNADGSKPASPLLKRTKFTLAAGSHTPVVTDNA